MLASYVNGNVTTKLFHDGTRERVINGDSPIFEFPENIDIKITNFCDMDKVCTYCHEQSNPKGNHANLNVLGQQLSVLPAGIELAIGGGSTTSHPQLRDFLVSRKEVGHVANLTVNQLHLKQHKSLIQEIISQDLAKGIGISYRTGTVNLEYLADYEHSVIHLIAGIDHHSTIAKLADMGYKKFLVLGYKTFGNGDYYYDQNKESVDASILQWRAQIARYLSKGLVISFDNLAIDQLKIRRFMTKEEWSVFYQGDDFTCSMYIDAVEQKYAPTSRSGNRKSFSETSLLEFFQSRERYIDVTRIHV